MKSFAPSVLCGLLLVVAGCSLVEDKDEDYLKAGPALQREIDSRMANLPYLRGAELLNSLRRLIWIGEPAIPALIEGMESDDPKTRGAVIYVLGELKDPRVVEPLRDALDDDVPEVRYEAAASLVAIGDWNTLPVLIDGLEEPSLTIRLRCIGLLKEKVGEDFGYVADGPESERETAVRKWEEWWRASRDGELL